VSDPTQIQELYWLSRRLDEVIDLVAQLSLDVEEIKRDRAVEKAADTFKEETLQGGKRRWEWIERAVLGMALGAVGWILREIIGPILTHLRR
jgi:hypothetical protein